MKQDFLKYYKSSVLIFLIGILLFIVITAKNFWSLSISVFSIVSTLLILITTYLWKYKPFIWLYWVDDFSGRYEGVLSFQYRDESGETKTGELKHVKLINQSGSRITVSSFTIKKDGTKSSFKEILKDNFLYIILFIIVSALFKSRKYLFDYTNLLPN